jgi:hypothetical protein
MKMCTIDTMIILVIYNENMYEWHNIYTKYAYMRRRLMTLTKH